MERSEMEKALHLLYDRVRSDPEYRTEKMGDRFVPGDGDPASSIVFVGEAPGQDEEKQQKPFVGAAGRNLKTLLEGIGLSRQDVFITNLVKYRPFDSGGKNRKPTVRESRKALPYLLEELSILQPQVVVCLGSSAAAMLTGEQNLRMGEANGKVFQSGGLNILVSYHPSPYNYLSESRREAMADSFRKLKELYHPEGA